MGHHLAALWFFGCSVSWITIDRTSKFAPSPCFRSRFEKMKPVWFTTTSRKRSLLTMARLWLPQTWRLLQGAEFMAATIRWPDISRISKWRLFTNRIIRSWYISCIVVLFILFKSVFYFSTWRTNYVFHIGNICHCMIWDVTWWNQSHRIHVWYIC